MTGVHGTDGYARTRLHARLGARGAAETQRQRMLATVEAAAFLQQARGSAWTARHVGRLAAGMSVHELERRLRDEWVTTVEEVARWHPRAWQPSLRWLRWLPWLPALQKLARGGRAPSWTRDDPTFAGIVAADRGTRAARLGDTALRPLQDAVVRHGDVVAAWVAHWRTLWPAAPGTQAALARLVRDVTRASEAFTARGAAASSNAALRALAAVLRRRFRRDTSTGVAAVAWLGLEALDLLELRGALAVRTVVPP
jgi:hypothetical protein